MEAPLRCELHAHSNWSDGRLPLEQVIDLYGRRGFDVLCITDHVVRGREMVPDRDRVRASGAVGQARP